GVQYRLAGAVSLGQLRAGEVGYERTAVEGRVTLAPDAVGGGQVDAVRHGVAEHGALPHVAGVEPADLGRFRADGGGVEEQVGALEGHDACCLGEPLVPADADA